MEASIKKKNNGFLKKKNEKNSSSVNTLKYYFLLSVFHGTETKIQNFNMQTTKKYSLNIILDVDARKYSSYKTELHGGMDDVS